MVEITTDLYDNTVGMVELFADVATTDPLVAVVLLLGALLVFFSAGVFGVLSVGAVLAAIRRLVPEGELHPPRAR